LIAQKLKTEGIKAVEKMSIQLGIPIRPAAAERLPTAQEIFEKIGPCIAQPKLDGFRLQIHIDNTVKKPKMLFFSRNLKNMSAMFPDLVKSLAALKVDTMICEGEAIGYDANTKTFLPFQETVKRKRKHGIDQASQEFPLKLFLFDLLYLNGKSLLDVPGEQRYTMLKKIVPAADNSPVACIEERKINSAHELEDYFKEVIHEGLEGLVVKRPNAIYQPGKRNFNWIKFKRTAQGELEDTIDAVVLGYYAGSGRRADFGIGAFLVGIYNKRQDHFETVAKVGTGLSDAQWIELRKKCDALKVPERPHNVECAKELYPDVWVFPEIVCEVFADEITRSPLHTAGKTVDHEGLGLRFPRFIQYREDKRPEDATSIAELKEMFEHQGKKG
jgi:DNA ligase-1